MVLTNAQKQSRYYAKHKNEEAFKSRIKGKDFKVRQKIKCDIERLNNVRQKVNARIKKFRQRQKLMTSSCVAEESLPYKSIASLSKAVHRAKRNLPTSPRKAKTVLLKLASNFGIPLEKRRMSSKPTLQLDVSVAEKVCSFYERDEYSCISPNRKDVCKDNTQKQYLIMGIMELYHEFKLQFPELTIGKSKFYTLRPSHVFLHENIPHDQCLCKHHENIDLILQKLHAFSKEIPNSGENLLNHITCNFNELCYYEQSCQNCCSDEYIANYFSTLLTNEVLQQNVVFSQWSTTEGRVSLTEINGTTHMMVSNLLQQISDFKKHCFINQAQKKYFRHLRESLCQAEQCNTLVLQIDFSENFSLRFQREIQSAYFVIKQVRLCLRL